MNTFWRDKRVLVTGANGLLGGWLTQQLQAEQAETVVLLRDWVPQSELVRSKLIEQVRVVRGQLQNQALLERVLGEYEVEVVFHLAAQTIVPIANRNPVSTFESNIRGTWALLEACRRSPRVSQIIVASSDKAYGAQEKLPYHEGMPLVGRHPYDVSKSCADLVAQSYAATYQLPVVIARCGNLFGGGDLNWNRIVPGTIRSVLRGEAPIIRSDGTLTRDYFYVEDGARAYLHLAEALGKTPDLAGEAFNFSNGQPLSVLEVTQEILGLMKQPEPAPVVQNEAHGEIPHQYLDASKAKERLGWVPAFSLQEGLTKTIDWYREFLNGGNHHD